MSNTVAWIAAEAERPEAGTGGFPKRRRETDVVEERISVRGLPVHRFPASADVEEWTPGERERSLLEDREREQRIYRGRTVAMLRRYMRYSLETGRLPSLVGREFFRSNVTKYRVTTFEDRVIFVHDMETCLQRLDEFSRQVLGRVVLQEYEHEDAARLLGCTRMTVHRKLLEALDKLIEVLIKVGLLDALSSNAGKACQEAKEDQFLISDDEQGKYKV
jgi:DNA-directed RNA polymerase specialized sigma24 family protein